LKVAVLSGMPLSLDKSVVLPLILRNWP
jgi:hypothetical protein